MRSNQQPTKMKTSLKLETITLGEIETPAIQMTNGNAWADERCICCGRKMKPSAVQYWVRVSNNGFFIPTALKVDEMRDLGYSPVGSDCAKRFPSEFVLITN